MTSQQPSAGDKRKRDCSQSVSSSTAAAGTAVADENVVAVAKENNAKSPSPVLSSASSSSATSSRDIVSTSFVITCSECHTKGQWRNLMLHVEGSKRIKSSLCDVCFHSMLSSIPKPKTVSSNRLEPHKLDTDRIRMAKSILLHVEWRKRVHKEIIDVVKTVYAWETHTGIFDVVASYLSILMLVLSSATHVSFFNLETGENVVLETHRSCDDLGDTCESWSGVFVPAIDIGETELAATLLIPPVRGENAYIPTWGIIVDTNSSVRPFVDPFCDSSIFSVLSKESAAAAPAAAATDVLPSKEVAVKLTTFEQQLFKEACEAVRSQQFSILNIVDTNNVGKYRRIAFNWNGRLEAYEGGTKVAFDDSPLHLPNEGTFLRASQDSTRILLFFGSSGSKSIGLISFSAQDSLAQAQSTLLVPRPGLAQVLPSKSASANGNATNANATNINGPSTSTLQPCNVRHISCIYEGEMSMGGSFRHGFLWYTKTSVYYLDDTMLGLWRLISIESNTMFMLSPNGGWNVDPCSYCNAAEIDTLVANLYCPYFFLKLNNNRLFKVVWPENERENARCTLSEPVHPLPTFENINLQLMP